MTRRHAAAHGPRARSTSSASSRHRRGVAAGLRARGAPGRPARGGAGAAAPGAGGAGRPGADAGAGAARPDRAAGRALAARAVRRLPGQPRPRRRRRAGAVRRAATRRWSTACGRIRLDMAGFTVFRDETTVDFTDADFFALVGPTGSGKSTVLDAICFALYGTVPRWGGARGSGQRARPVGDRGPGAAGLRVGRRPLRGHPGGAPRRQGQRQDRRRRAAADAAPAST